MHLDFLSSQERATIKKRLFATINARYAFVVLAEPRIQGITAQERAMLLSKIDAEFAQDALREISNLTEAEAAALKRKLPKK